MLSDPSEPSLHAPVALRPARRPTIRSLAEVVSRCSGVPVLEILGPRHTPVVSKARQVVMWLARRYTSSSTTIIAVHTGRRNHTSVLYSVGRVDLAIRDSGIAAPLCDTPEAWAAALWAAEWPRLGNRDPMKLPPS